MHAHLGTTPTAAAVTPTTPDRKSKRDGMIFTVSPRRPSPLSETLPTPLLIRPSSFSSSSSSETLSSSDSSDERTVRSASTASSNSTSPTVRKLSRKLPPHLTESLELLTIVEDIQPVVPVAKQPHLFSPAYTLGAPFSGLPLPLPLALPPTPAPKNPARKMSVNKASISGPSPAQDKPLPSPVAQDKPLPSLSPSAATETDALPPLIPRTSLPSLRAGPRHSLFGSSSLFRQAHPSSSTSSLRSPRDSVDHPRFAPSEGVPALSCSNSATESSCGTNFSSFDAEYHQAGQSSGASGRENRKQRRARLAAEKARFDESTPPTTKELYEASLLDVIDDTGAKVRFGDLVRGRKTIVVFIRHWFCPLCAQYIKSVIRDVSPDALDDAGVDLIIIGNGSAKMINGYANKYFNSPFKTYTDPTLSLYRRLGLTRQTMDAGSDSERGDYLTESALETTVNTLKRASKMPLRNPGHFTQLGGEFVFDGTLNVIYTHRMINTRAHAPIRDVCREAGVRLEFIHYEPGPAPPAVHMRSTDMLGHFPEVHSAGAGEEAEVDDWFAQKEKTLERIREMRAERRKGSVDHRSMDRGVKIVIPEEDEEMDEFGQLTRELYA